MNVDGILAAIIPLVTAFEQLGVAVCLRQWAIQLGAADLLELTFEDAGLTEPL